jgi:uncharacterized protein (TIGR02246 family)
LVLQAPKWTEPADFAVLASADIGGAVSFYIWRKISTSGLSSGSIVIEDSGMDRQELQVWLEAYARAWMDRDAEAAAGLYAENATYQETPFSPPLRGREAILGYWKNVARTQEDIHVECRIMAVAGEESFAHWHASFVRLPMGIQLELDGIFLLTFDAEKRCTSLREWWHRKEIPVGRS